METCACAFDSPWRPNFTVHMSSFLGHASPQPGGPLLHGTLLPVIATAAWPEKLASMDYYGPPWTILRRRDTFSLSRSLHDSHGSAAWQ